MVRALCIINNINWINTGMILIRTYAVINQRGRPMRFTEESKTTAINTQMFNIRYDITMIRTKTRQLWSKYRISIDFSIPVPNYIDTRNVTFLEIECTIPK